MSAQPVFVEASGLVSVEAESGSVINRGQGWFLRSGTGGYSGSGYLAAEPNQGTDLQRGYVGVAPEVQFRVRFSRAGTYYVWIRGFAPSIGDNSVHSGLDGAVIKSGSAISDFPISAWGWSSQTEGNTRRITLDVTSAGLHVVNVWMKEDGFQFDKIVLTTDGGFVPAGGGPVESAREGGGGGTSPVLSLSPTSVSLAAAAGGASPPSQNVAVSFANGAAAWTAAKNAAWLSVSPAGGTGNGGLAVAVNPTGLGAGVYSDTIAVSAPGAVGSPATVGVSFMVAGISTTPAAPVFTTSSGSNSAAQNLTINLVGASPAWNLSGVPSWLSVSAASGTGSATISMTALGGSLAAGSYSGTLVISAPGFSSLSVPVSLTVTGPAPTEFYVSPSGSSSGDGSLNRPWDIATALAGPAVVRPGATIWIRGGSYGSASTVLRVNLVGTPSAPIIVRAYPGERATILSNTQVGCCDAAPDPSQGAYVWLWGLEFTNLDPVRISKQPGADVFAVGARMINNVLHDTAQGIGFWKSAINGELHGNIVYNNGMSLPDRGHGHGIYSQNDSGVKKLTDNIVFNQFGWGLHLYGTSASEVRNYIIDGNISFNNGTPSGTLNDNILLAGGGSGLSGIDIRNNHFYMTPSTGGGFNEVGWIFSSSNADAIVADNYFIGGRDALAAFGWKTMTFVRNKVLSTSDQVWLDTQVNGKSGFTWGDNAYYGISGFRYNGQTMNYPSWQATTGFDSSSSFQNSLPTGVWTFVRKNQCEAGRGHIVIYNWDLAASVNVDVSAILSPGMSYEVRDAQNFWGTPVGSGTYTGGSITIPMTGLSVDPVQGGPVAQQPAHTAPQYGVFVVLQRATSSKTCS